MTFNECRFCFYLFCNYYDGKTTQDIPNMEGTPQYIKIDASKMRISKGSSHTTFESTYVIFYFAKGNPNKFKLNHLTNYIGERKFYASVKDFLNHFKIPFKDIV